MPAGAALSRVRNAGQYNPPLLCGCSSVDRVLASEAKGRGFDPRQPHHFLMSIRVRLPQNGWPLQLQRILTASHHLIW